MKKIRNFLSLFLSIVMVLTMIPFANMQRVYAGDNDVITDPALKRAINKSLDPNPWSPIRTDDQAITVDDMNTIGKLYITEPITDWGKLKDMPKLKEIQIENLNEFDIKNISELTSLEILMINPSIRLDDIEDTPTSLKNIDSLQNLQNLINLIMGNCNLTDFDAKIISKLDNLKHLALYKNNITNLSIFLDIKNLTDLDLSNNKIEDISALGKMPSGSKLNSIILANNIIANHNIPNKGNKFMGYVNIINQTINVSTDTMLMANPLVAPNDKQSTMNVDTGGVEFQDSDKKTLKILNFDGMSIGSTTTATLSYDNGALERVKAELIVKKISNTEHNITIDDSSSLIQELLESTIGQEHLAEKISSPPKSKAGQIITIVANKDKVNEQISKGFDIKLNVTSSTGNFSRLLAFVSGNSAPTFEMPDEDVTIKVELVPKKFNLTLKKVHYPKDSSPVETIISSNTYLAGEKVKLTVLKKENGYYFEQWKGISPIGTPGEPNIDYPMPAGDITLTAEYRPIDLESFDIFAENGGERKTVLKVGERGATISPENFVPDDSYTAFNQDISRYYSSNENVIKIDQFGNIEPIAEGESTITAYVRNSNGIEIESRPLKITVSNSTQIEKTYKAQIINGKITKIDNNAITSTNMQNIKEGAIVNITADEISGKTFQKWQVNSGNVRITTNTDKSIAFVMPANDVTIEAIYKDIPKTTPTPKPKSPAGGGGGGGGGASTPTKRSISTDSSSTKNGTISIDKDKAESNQKITITTKPDKGYETKNVVVKTLNGREIKVTKNSDNSYSFEMPMEEVKISAEFVKKEEQKKIETKKETEKPKQVVSLKIGSTEMSKTLDGKTSKMQSDVAPFIKNGRTMMPLRYVAEALGLEVKWDNSTRTAILKDGKREIRVPVDTNQIIIEGKTYISDVMPIIENSRTYLSISNLAKALGLVEGVDILWNSETKEVTISRPLAE